MKTRILALFTALLLVAMPLASCDIGGSDGALLNEQGTGKYESGDYHFILTYPAPFSLSETVAAEDNDDECTFIFTAMDNKYEFRVVCEYLKNDDLYSYITDNSLPYNKLKPISDHSFVYDMRSESTKRSGYKIISATNRMLITVHFAFDSEDRGAYLACEMFDFEFTEYANITKNNEFLSPVVTISGRFGVRIPAHMNYRLLPEAAEGALAVHNELVAESENLFLRFCIPTARYQYSDIADLILDTDGDSLAALLAGDDITDITFIAGSVYNSSSKEIFTLCSRQFECNYNGKPASGTLVAGFGAYAQYIEGIYLITDDADTDELNCYMDMVGSFTSKP